MPAIEVSHLTKEYRLGALQGLKQTLLNTGARLAGKPVPERPLFKALDDVSFSIEQGEVVGIIGHNGAGKSTLLKTLARVTTPSSGSVKVNGRIAPLIEVGAGFVPDFTGRENVYLNGAILGMSRREIDRKFDEIVDFAEMAEFIDTPVKRYSSGMQVKLAFAVATSIDSEILIIDEVLAVGDLAFQRKCFTRLESLINKDSRTVLVVSHNIRQIERICKRVVLLDHGHILSDGKPKEVCDAFYSQSQNRIAQHAKSPFVRQGRLESSGEVELVFVKTLDSLGNQHPNLQTGDSFTLQIRIRTLNCLDHISFGVGLHTTDFVYLTTHNSEITSTALTLQPGEHDIFLHIKDFPLLPGVYMLRMGVTSGVTQAPQFYGENLLQITVSNPKEKRIPASMREGFFALNAEWDFSRTIPTAAK